LEKVRGGRVRGEEAYHLADDNWHDNSDNGGIVIIIIITHHHPSSSSSSSISQSVVIMTIQNSPSVP